MLTRALHRAVRLLLRAAHRARVPADRAVRARRRLWRLWMPTVAVCCTAACNAASLSQRGIARMADDDPLLTLIHQTPLYNVYYDHGLKRCVLYAAMTTAEGNGASVVLFNCDPKRLATHVATLRARQQLGTAEFPLPDEPPRRVTAPAQSPPASPPPSPATPAAPEAGQTRTNPPNASQAQPAPAPAWAPPSRNDQTEDTP